MSTTDTDTTLNAARAALTTAGYTVHDRSHGPGLYIADVAPDSEGASTEPGSPWDDECSELLDAIRSELTGLRVTVEWDDDDVAITAAGGAQ